MRLLQKSLLLLLLVALAVPAWAEDKVPSDENSKLSYSLGFQFGEDLKSKGIQVDPDMLAKGLRDAQVGLGALMNREEMRATLEAVHQKLVARQRKAMEAVSAANKKAGEHYLAKNAARKGVKVTASGLQYEVVKAGTGRTPKPTDQVSVNYRGTLVDGTEFDSSYKHGGKPVSFPVNGVIKGWQEALLMMKEGAKWKLAIPAKLAYGERGAPPYIGPNSTLLFEVELVSIK